jgi:hypothetical protein
LSCTTWQSSVNYRKHIGQSRSPLNMNREYGILLIMFMI